MLNLKIARIKKNIKQRELAELIGVNLNTVSRWESGTQVIGSDNLIKLADILNCTTDYLLGRE